jgi:predicted nucleotidyltransferase
MEKLISAAEFAKVLGIGVERVRQLCKSGRVANARQITVGAASMWLIPSHAPDPRRHTGRPRKSALISAESAGGQGGKTTVFRKLEIDQEEVQKRLELGLREAEKIIKAMKKEGVIIEVFGSMKKGRPFPNSDLDLLVTDCGGMDPEVVTYQIELLSGEVPVDVTFLDYVPKASLSRVMESRHG